MKKHFNISIKYFLKKLSFGILSVLLLISFITISIPLDVSAQKNEFSEAKTNLSPLQNEINDSLYYTVEQVVDELIGNINIANCEYLYNLDNSADYIYVEFAEGGYAIFLKETMEMLEYSTKGKLNYPEISFPKYYGGPSFYLFKKNNCFVNIASNEYLDINEDSAQTYANKVRESLLSNYKARKNSRIVEVDYSILEKDKASEAKRKLKDSEDPCVEEEPKLDQNSLIRVTDGTYIPNYRYFLLDPSHGNNTSGTCGAVAAQLLLSYNNYYTDRRIIAYRHLNGDTKNPESNPNLCEDPMKMTSDTLGTKGYDESGSDYENSYFHYVVDNIPKSATTTQVVNGLKNIVSNRNKEIGRPINYSINSKTGHSSNGLTSVDPSGIISELDSGRPLILLMQESLGGLNHYVVAYGYNNYTYPGSTDEYLGFITHFGWHSNYLNIWVNSAWCYSYITLKIEHTHRYFFARTISGTNRTEYRCDICGHRTDAAINMFVKDRYIERFAAIPQNGYEYKDFYVTFATAGNKLFQTFGANDTTLYLFDAEYNLLAYNDDSGQGLNSLFSYTVETEKPYILRVKFYHDYTTGDVKVGVTPASVTYSTYEKIWNIKANHVTYSFSPPLNSTCIMTFTPTESRTYTFQTNYLGDTQIDTYLYVVDPYSTNACLYDDNGAGNLQALISMDLVAERTYFIVASTYNIANMTGTLTLEIFPK